MAHKVNLLRASHSDARLWHMLQECLPDFCPDTHAIKGGIQRDQLYRSDQPQTRQLKTALNYQLDRDNLQRFINPLFRETHGDEVQMCNELYLGLQDMAALQDQVRLMFHGNRHLLWSELSPAELASEVTPPPELSPLLHRPYLLSIPFGMAGSYQPEQLIAQGGAARGAFTMLRNTNHQHGSSQEFAWLHRYDQADFFDQQQQLKPLFRKLLAL